jgi:hypothetical protein
MSECLIARPSLQRGTCTTKLYFPSGGYIFSIIQFRSKGSRKGVGSGSVIALTNGAAEAINCSLVCSS